MKKVVLLSCVSKKKDTATNAENMYDSTLFKYALKYAQSHNPDKIFILSAQYGLLETSDVIKPYNKTLNKMKKNEQLEWSNLVLRQMIVKKLDLKKDHFIILAGNRYRKYLLDYITHYELPLEGKRIGEQLSFLKGAVINE
ncbi:DUF6884 domain-containing protein [Pseudalkalibacillus sp. SCS-8]|uniref:DUF6884 domain-containing protein n=1 Tax=Pseudalkalibacillus nanhaiensis TaxID=3115291 RepID=UPI0032DB1C54